MRRTHAFLVPLVGFVVVAASVTGLAQSDEADRLREAGVVFEEIMSAPDSTIPASVLGKAEGIAIFPSTLKVGFIFGAHRGKGVLSVRDKDSGEWSSPAFLTLTGGSFGAQIGGQSTDIVLGRDESARAREPRLEPVQDWRRCVCRCRSGGKGMPPHRRTSKCGRRS